MRLRVRQLKRRQGESRIWISYRTSWHGVTIPLARMQESETGCGVAARASLPAAIPHALPLPRLCRAAQCNRVTSASFFERALINASIAQVAVSAIQLDGHYSRLLRRKAVLEFEPQYSRPPCCNHTHRRSDDRHRKESTKLSGCPRLGESPPPRLA